MMKKKEDKIELRLAYETGDAGAVSRHVSGGNADEFRFDIEAEDTILFMPSKDEAYRLRLRFSGKKDENCMRFLHRIKDPARLQTGFALRKDVIVITFYTTRLTEEETDKSLFGDGVRVTDVDDKVMIGLILNNRFHG